MQYHNTRKSNAAFFVFCAVALVVGIYFISIIITTQIEIKTKENELINLQNIVLSAQAENEELQRAYENDSEEAYIERVAREKLGYYLPDERIYVDMSGN